MVQGRGGAMRMSRPDFLKFLGAHSEFEKILLRYSQALHVQVAQTAVCNGRHKVSQRLTRWLLEAHDRMGSPVLMLSHEFLSYMLGSRRASISEELKKLKYRGFIQTGHN